MKRILVAALIIILAGCSRQESDFEKLQKLLEENQRQARNIDLSSKLTTRSIAPVKDDAELKNICDHVMEKVGQGDLRAAFEEMSKYSILPKSEMDNAYTATQKQLDLVQGRFGKFIGYEYVSAVQVSASLVKYVYIAKCENHVLPWYFVFYKPKDKWSLNYFYWNDKPQDIRF